MTDSGRCSECGSPVAETGPAGGLCPRCLIKSSLPSQGPTRTGGGRERFTPPEPAEIAKHFPQLEIIELIGCGGMGAVYKARQPALNRFVAVKILAPERVRDPAFAERFSREARTLARLSHPHIVGIHDFGEADGLYYLIMEYVNGAGLREIMRAGRLSAADALALVPQICDALQFAHEAGVVHRDIKPENILLDDAGRVKIADFGMAKLLQPDRAEGVSLTVSGAVMGTPAYMAPEQIEHPLEVDHRADIYAVGVVFYEMLTGELPLGRFDPPSSRVKLDVRLDQVVLRALAKEPIRRYQFANDVTADLQQLDKIAPDSTSSGPGPAPGTRTVNVTRPPLVSWIAVYSFLMAAFLPALAGLTLLWLLIGFRGYGPSFGLMAGAPVRAVMTGAMGIPFGAGLFVLFGVWHLIAGLGALKLRNWSRFNLIVLAVLELPFALFASLSWTGLVMLPVTVASALILVYLFSPSVARIFELGLGPSDLPASEADAIEKTLGRRSWA